MRTADEMRQAVVFSALHEYYNQKFQRIGNSLRPLRDDARVKAYWKRVLGPTWKGPYPLHWCAAYALWSIQEAGLAAGVIQRVNRVNGSGYGFCEPQRLPKTAGTWCAGKSGQELQARIKPGDVAYFERNQHHAIVEAVDSIGMVWTVDGNQPAIDRHGPQGTLPARHVTKVTCFYSIEPFVARALAEEAPKAQ
jgi:hypothetical protein